MYGLMVTFDPTRATAVSGRRNKGLNFGNVVADSKTAGDGDHGGSCGMKRKLYCWHCGGEHLKSKCPKCAEEKEKKKG